MEHCYTDAEATHGAPMNRSRNALRVTALYLKGGAGMPYVVFIKESYDSLAPHKNEMCAFSMHVRMRSMYGKGNRRKP